MTTARKSRREALHDFGKPEHLHKRNALATARRLREQENRRRQVEAAMREFLALAREEHHAMH